MVIFWRLQFFIIKYFYKLSLFPPSIFFWRNFPGLACFWTGPSRPSLHCLVFLPIILLVMFVTSGALHLSQSLPLYSTYTTVYTVDNFESSIRYHQYCYLDYHTRQRIGFLSYKIISKHFNILYLYLLSFSN